MTAVMTDNGSCYRSRAFAAALGDIHHRWTKPYRPQTNGKVEGFNRTLAAEWAYSATYASDEARVPHRVLRKLNACGSKYELSSVVRHTREIPAVAPTRRGGSIRASRRTRARYERDQPGDLIHVDVKKARPDPRRVEVGVCTALTSSTTTRAGSRVPSSDSTTSTLPSMIAPGSRSRRSCQTKREAPALRSWPTRPRSSPATASESAR